MYKSASQRRRVSAGPSGGPVRRRGPAGKEDEVIDTEYVDTEKK